MRISDWSSDVCSSDLPARLVQDGSVPALRVAGRTHPPGVAVPAAVVEREIGRASCRERVCQYVSISVVAASLKQQELYTTTTPSRSVHHQQAASQPTPDTHLSNCYTTTPPRNT